MYTMSIINVGHHYAIAIISAVVFDRKDCMLYDAESDVLAIFVNNSTGPFLIIYIYIYNYRLYK